MRGMAPKQRHATLTFTEVPGTQKVDANHEKDHNRDVNGHMLELISGGQIVPKKLSSRNSHWYPST